MKTEAEEKLQLLMAGHKAKVCYKYSIVIIFNFLFILIFSEVTVDLVDTRL